MDRSINLVMNLDERKDQFQMYLMYTDFPSKQFGLDTDKHKDKDKDKDNKLV